MIKKQIILFSFIASCTLVAMESHDELHQATVDNNYAAVMTLLKTDSHIHRRYREKSLSLYTATEKGFEDIVQLLLENKADPCQPTENTGLTPWHAALINRRFSIVNMFLKISLPNWSILIPAVKTGNPEVLKKILDQGKPDLALMTYNFECSFGSHLLAIIVRENIENGDKLAQVLLNYRAPVHRILAHQNISLLGLAVLHNKIDLCDRFITHGSNLEIGDSKHFKTPLFIAVEQKNLPMVEFLLKKGANPNGTYPGAPFSKSIIHQATKGQAAIMSLLVVYGADINTTDKHGKTPLHDAIIHNNKEIIELLLQQKGILINHQDPRHAMTTPLHEAAYHRLSKITQLLTKNGADPNIRNSFGRTPVHDAVLNDSPKTVSILLQTRPALDVTDNEGQTPLFVAVSNRSLDMVHMLLHARANPSISAHTISPAHKAAHLGENQILRTLISHGANVHAKNFLGRTPLHDAAGKVEQLAPHEPTMVYLLISAGADPNVIDSEGATPLFKAVKHGMPSGVEQLLEAGADPNIPCGTITPLHEAAYTGSIDNVRNLLKHGAVVNTKNCFGRTPLHDAVICSFMQVPPEKKLLLHKQLLQLLMAHNADKSALDNKRSTPIMLLNRLSQYTYQEINFLLQSFN